MDDLNVHQFWGISPFIDLLAASAAVGLSTDNRTVSFLQVCPYDCRHTLATISSRVSKQLYAGTAADVACAAPVQQQQQQPCQQHRQLQQLQLYIYESEPEVLARHMLLLGILFDPKLTPRERAEMFLELHGNVMLRQKTADYLAAASKALEASVAQLSLCAAPVPSGQQQHEQQQQRQRQEVSELGVLQVFDLSLLKYQERDALLETFQKYRQKASFNMAKAWDDRSRKWYGDRYDFRSNMIDWDYHMRLGPRGTPFQDPTLGSIIHFYHFRHWRLTGIAHELRGSSYVAANTSLLSTAYGRTKEFKDRQLRDVGRSVSAFSYWGDLLNSPYNAFGTIADDPGLFKVANKQFMHTAVDVAEHNILGFLGRLRSGCQSGTTTAASAGASAVNGTTSCSSSSSSAATTNGREAHRSNAARGPTSLSNLTAATASTASLATAEAASEAAKGEVAEAKEVAERVAEAASEVAAGGGEAGIGSLTAPTAHDVQQQQLQELSITQQQEGAQADRTQQQQQQQSADEFALLEAVEAALTQSSIKQLLACTKILLLSGDLKRSLTGKSKFAGQFTAATLGHRHIHMLSPDYGLASVLKPDGFVLVESGQNMVQLNNEQVGALEAKVVEMAAGGGFKRHAALADPSSTSSSSSGGWRLPPGHFALEVQQQSSSAETAACCQ